MTAPYIPSEIVEKHRLRAAVRLPAADALTMRLGGEKEPMLHNLAACLAREMAPRLRVDSQPFDFGHYYGFHAEVFVFTRDELAELLETRYVRIVNDVIS